MLVNDWITSNYVGLQKATAKITSSSSFSEDLLSESLLIFLEKSNVNEIVNTGGAMYYIVRIMLNNYHSNTSPFYRKYRSTEQLVDEDSRDGYKYLDKSERMVRGIKNEFFKYHEMVNIREEQPNYDLEHDLLESDMMLHYEDLNWYHKELMDLHYVKGESISKISRGTGIPRSSIALDLKRAKSYIREKMNDKK